jgi:LacI family transcriptional regulator, purine nucleotide synthesis repressor
VAVDRPVAPKARLRDVAALAGVSVASASQVLSGGPAGEQTRHKVLQAARQLRYVPHAGARELRKGAPSTVAMWVLNRPDAEELTENNSFYYALMRGALDELDRAGHSFDFRVGEHPAGDALLGAALSGRYRALVVVPQWDVDGLQLEELDRLAMPCVTVNRVRRSGVSVRVDHAAGIGLAVGHLAVAGHRAIGYLAGPEGHLDAEERLAAFYRHAAAAGVQVHEEWVLRTSFSIETGRETMRTLLSKKKAGAVEMPTALLAANDYVAAGALRACAEMGVRVPEELSIVGFDDIDVARATVPALTTVHQPLRELGHSAARAVLQLADGGEADSVVLQPTLVERESVTVA